MKISIWGLLLITRLAWADGTWSDSGIKGPKYSEILASMETLKNENPDLVSLHNYGVTKRGRTLQLVLIKKDVSVTGKRTALFISGSTHGNEYLNIEDRLPGEVVKKSKTTGPVSDFLDEGGVFLFVPILNPDGYDARQRENANGVDLNRDWDVTPVGFKGFKENETKLLAAKLSELRASLQLDLKVSVDYHCCIGALLHPWSYENAPALKEGDLEAHKAIGELVNRYLSVDVGTTGDILGYYPLGTTKDYYYQEYGALAFTYEGKYAAENRYLEKHVSWWEDVLRFLRARVPQFALGISNPRKSPLLKLTE